MNPAKEKIITEIFEAFKNVTLEDGVGLLESEIIDDYGSDTQRKNARNQDEKSDWQKLVNSETLLKSYGSGGLSFFDDKGLRFHLPAYLLTVIQHPSADIGESLIFHLTDLSDYTLERLKILNQKQKTAILHFLKYVIKELETEYAYDLANLQNSIDQYWSKVDS